MTIDVGADRLKKISIDAFAKVNLSLDVLYKRDDGYHELRMIMQQIGLKDVIKIEEREKGITIECNNSNVPVDSSNLVYKVWDIISKTYNIDKGIHINIQKNIPMAGGLAGGSSNASAVLKGLNELWNLGLPQGELMDLGLNIGADVPYCIMGGTALAEGVGERLTRLKSFSGKYILLANPGIQVSTAYVYNNLKLDNISKRPDTDILIEYIETDNVSSLAKNMVNVLESVTVQKYPAIQKIKDDMMSFGALGSIMSGSGATVFGIFDSKDDMKKCYHYLQNNIKTVIMTKTI